MRWILLYLSSGATCDVLAFAIWWLDICFGRLVVQIQALPGYELLMVVDKTVPVLLVDTSHMNFRWRLLWGRFHISATRVNSSQGGNCWSMIGIHRRVYAGRGTCANWRQTRRWVAISFSVRDSYSLAYICTYVVTRLDTPRSYTCNFSSNSEFRLRVSVVFPVRVFHVKSSGALLIIFYFVVRFTIISGPNWD